MIYYIDPQSYSNLAVYDYSLISNISDVDIRFWGNTKYDYKVPENVRTNLAFSYSNKSNGIAKIMSYSKTMTAIAWRAIRERPSAIHIQWIKFWPLDYLLVFIMHCFGIRIIHTAHNLLPHSPKRFDKFCYTLYYKAVDKIIVHSGRTKAELAQLIGSDRKIHVIHHGILPSNCNESVCKEHMKELRAEYGITPDTVVFACMGLQNKYKGTDMVLEAWKRSKILQNEKTVLFIIGKNENIDYSVVKGIANVHIVNKKVSQSDFDAYLRIVSVVLLPYIKISQSGVLFTALEAGVPVMVTDVGGLAEPLDIADIGWNIGKPKLSNLQAALENMVGNRTDIEKKRNNTEAFMKVRKAYSWNKIAKQTAILYKFYEQ